MRTACITGAGGFSARHLAARLRRETNVRIIGIDRLPAPHAAPLYDAFVCADIGQREEISAVVRQYAPDWFFHLAGINRGTPEAIYSTNLVGSVSIMEALREHAPRTSLLLAGSAAEYGRVEAEAMPILESHPCHPEGDYGISKYAMTLAGMDYARRYGMKVVVARPFNIVGGGVPETLVLGGILKRLKEAQALGGDPVVKVGNLDTERDFIAVQDVADAYVRMVQSNVSGEVFNLCSGKAHSIRTVLDLLLSHAERPVHLEVDPALVRSSDVKTVYGSGDKARRLVDFEPHISLEEAVRNTWEYAMEGTA